MSFPVAPDHRARPVPRCCGYCQSRSVVHHCQDVGAPYCNWIHCTKCGANTGYSRAGKGERTTNVPTWHLVFTKGQRTGYSDTNSRPG